MQTIPFNNVYTPSLITEVVTTDATAVDVILLSGTYSFTVVKCVYSPVRKQSCTDHINIHVYIIYIYIYIYIYTLCTYKTVEYYHAADSAVLA